MLKIPTIEGVIRRRILVNYRIIPEFVQPLLPPKFRPKLHEGLAIGGICLIRLEKIRVQGLPSFVGMSSENAAHRIAVVWNDDQGREQEGVYVPRRDTDSNLNRLAGGRLFPGEHHAAKFRVEDDGDKIDFEMNSKDGEVTVQVRGCNANLMSHVSGFRDVADASSFFEKGSLGYSATGDPGRLDGIRLQIKNWKVRPLRVEHAYSSFFANEKIFPKDTAAFDCALIMRDIEHEWTAVPELRV